MGGRLPRGPCPLGSEVQPTAVPRGQLGGILFPLQWLSFHPQFLPGGSVRQEHSGPWAPALLLLPPPPTVSSPLPASPPEGEGVRARAEASCPQAQHATAGVQ